MPRAGRTVALALGGAVAAFAAAAVALPRSASSPAPQRAAPATAERFPAPATPAFTPGPPLRLRHSPYVSYWAPVQRATVARARPGAGAGVAPLATTTAEGTDNLVPILAKGVDARGRPWLRVRLPVLPNGTTGWVRRTALGGYVAVRTRLVVDVDRLRATLYRDGRPVFRAPVGVGMPGWDTPRGRFYVRNRLTRYRSPTYGPIAFGTSARSPTATDWPAGGFVGIHGTDRPELIPGRVSHGCVRMRNADILALARRMPVGTPLVVR